MAIVAVISLVFSVANIIWTWWSKNNDASDKKVEEIETRVEGLKDRLAKVEGELQHLPSKDEFHRLALKVTEVSGQVSTIKSEIDGVGRTARRIEEHILGGKAA